MCVVITWVSGPVPGCSTARVRACFPLRQQLPGCHTPTTPPYLKMRLYFQQLLVELRVLHNMVSMANTLGLQDINCLESTGKALRASKHSPAPACPETPIPLQVQPSPPSWPLGCPFPAIRSDPCPCPQCSLCCGYGEDWDASVPSAGHVTPLSLPALSQELLVPP